MSDPVPWILLIGAALIWFGYSIWKSEKKEEMVDPRLLAHPPIQAGLNQGLTPLWFVSDPHDPRLLKLEDKAIKILREDSAPLRFVIHHAVAVFHDGTNIEMNDWQYTLNGRREGSRVDLDPNDEEPAVVEADTQGMLSDDLASYLRMEGVLVFVEHVDE